MFDMAELTDFFEWTTYRQCKVRAIHLSSLERSVEQERPDVASAIERALTTFWKRVGKRPLFSIEDYGWKLVSYPSDVTDYGGHHGHFAVEVL